MAPQYKSEKVELFFNKLGQVLSKLVASLSQKESLKRIDKRASNEMQFDPLPPPIRSPMHSPTIRPTDGLGLEWTDRPSAVLTAVPQFPAECKGPPRSMSAAARNLFFAAANISCVISELT